MPAALLDNRYGCLVDAAIHPANGQIFVRRGNKFEPGSGILAISGGGVIATLLQMNQ
jgi:hypothetical protein